MNILEEIQNCSVEWKELGEISQLYGGLTGKTKSDFENGNVKYVTYKNIFNNMQVELNILENVQVDENEKQNAIKYGDVLITGSSESKEEVGMSSAVTFVPDEPIYLNSFSFGIRFNEDVELVPEFTKYLFRSIGLRKQIEKTASGVTRYNISKVAFKKIKVPLLPKEIQEKIVQKLDKMTEYVTELTSELTSRNKQYSYYRDKLLSFEDEVYRVEWKELGGVVFTLTSPVKLAKKQYQLTGRIPIVDQGEQFIAGYTDNEKYLEKDEYIIFGDHSEHIKFVDFAFVQGADGLKILKPNKGINAKYLYYCVCNFYKKEGSYKRHWSNAKITLIPIPPLKIQEKVVQILDNFDKVCSDLNIGLPKEIELRQKQYEYWREQLLNFNK